MRQKLFSITQRLGLPSICYLCKQLNKGHHAICAHCITLMPLLGPACQQCAHPLPPTAHPLCGQCSTKKPYFDSTIVGYAFEEPLRSLLHAFKYDQCLFLGSFLSHLMLLTWQHMAMTTECLIPVPMHPTKLADRGFNQAAILTKILASHLNIPYSLMDCQKIINTDSQASLSASKRKTNLKGAFTCSPLPYEQVTLIDDLLTTGSTANELAKALKKAGVKTVTVWCCARAVAS